MTIEDLRASNSAAITRQDVADALGIDPRTVTEGIRQGNIPSLKIGRRVLIPREKFLALFDVAAA
ncbi:helix-turn-helix domain-containing protein [Microbacterium sp. EST19A]|uniref:helix-turn-helix domain-containing protein n=1 Tax=Microbacterium sp. EST19A TaxID=2862681 RepID=UPI001CBD3F9D|nr:helix-turn-helix domain-containing protein [Microbacterium sp. EST19A]